MKPSAPVTSTRVPTKLVVRSSLPPSPAQLVDAADVDPLTVISKLADGCPSLQARGEELGHRELAPGYVVKERYGWIAYSRR